MQIDHVAIWTNDLGRVKNFYQKYFDCYLGNKYENHKKQFSSYFLTFSNGARIELMKREGIVDKDKTEKLGLIHIAIDVGTREKVDSLTKQIEMDQFIIDSYPRITGDGYYESVILDPECNKIELTSIENLKINTEKYDNECK